MALIRIIEIAGLAGSGKSTISKLLNEENDVQLGVRIKWWANAHRLILYAPKCIGTAFSLGLNKRIWQRLKLFLYLEMLMDTLVRLKHEGPEILLLDQGPIYVHAFLTGRFVDKQSQSAIMLWSQNNLERWVDVLDGIVWLEASDAILLQRIANREKNHFLKRATNTEQAAFLSHYRDANKRILKGCETSGLEVLYLYTDELNAEDTTLKANEFVLCS